MGKDENCIFCKIVDGIIPSKSVMETENCIVVLDAFPATKGHVLIVTRDHKETLVDMTDAELSDVAKLMRDVGSAVKKATGCDGINFVNNLGEAAGQKIMHAHFHILPRYENDSVVMTFQQLKLTEEEADSLVKSIKAEL